MKTLMKLFAVAAIAAGLTAGLARAVPVLSISGDGGLTWVTVVGDATGQVTYNGSVPDSVWNITVDTGISKPAQGSVNSPVMDLSFVASSIGPSPVNPVTGKQIPLDIFLSDTGFDITGTVTDILSTTIGRAGGKVTDWVIKDFLTIENQDWFLTQKFTGAGGFTGTVYDTVSLLPEDDLTIAVVLTINGQGVISGDKFVTVVPDGGTTALLLGLGLLGMGLIRRSRKS